MIFAQNFMKIIIALFVPTSINCQRAPDFEALRSEILELHKATIDAHWKKDVDFFVKDTAKDYVFVQNGEIERSTKDEIIAKMSDYLNHTTFTEYRDLQEPIIGFSKDGSVAWSIVQVKVAGKRMMNDGNERDVDFTCAWITLYERHFVTIKGIELPIGDSYKEEFFRKIEYSGN